MRLRVHVLREVICPMLLLVPAGCKRSTPEPLIGEVPLKVWVVLSTVGDHFGEDDNMGCRLSTTEITNYIDALKNNRHVYGANFEFTWDGLINQVHTSHIPLCFLPPCPPQTDLCFRGDGRSD